jgi:hypothetical protein
MTLIGLLNYDNTLFDGLTLPEGYDKDTFVNSLLLEHGEKCVLYTNPEFFKSAIKLWGEKWHEELTRIYNALTAEYNPLWNYDRNEEWTDTNKPDFSNTRTFLNTDTQTNRYDIVTEQNEDSTSENTISADNSSQYQPDNKNISNAGKSTQSNDGTITDAHTGTITDRTSGKTDDAEHKGHLWGNIGVTTSVDMLSQEIGFRTKYNLYNLAASIFAKELLLAIY